MLTEAQRQARAMVRQFARKVFDEMARLGMMGMVVPEQYGGAGLDYVSYALAVIEIAAADGAASTAFQVHNSLVCLALLNYGNEDQKARYLRSLASGELLGAFCLTEPDAGSDAAAIKTRARRRGNTFVLNGCKQFITSGKSADLAIVFAVTDPDAGKKGVSAFVVPTRSPGVARVEHTMGQRGSDHCHVVFEDCEVLPEQMLGEEGQGLKIALANLE